MLPEDPAPSRVEYPSAVFGGLIAELQNSVVQVSLATRAHLGELQRVPPEGRHHKESHRLALAQTSRALAAATEGLNEAFAAMRDESRHLARLLMQTEKVNRHD